MMQSYIYNDEKSSKFWRIDYSGNDLVVNFGKTDSLGRFQIKEFEDENKCKKEALRLIASKIKKGYQEEKDFDPHHIYYFDDKDWGTHKKTSHPKFTQHFCDDFYYNCADEDAPFGSDEGNDTLYEIEESIRKNKHIDWCSFSQKMVEEYWGMDYIHPEEIDRDSLKKKLEEDKDYERDVLQSDQVTIAVGFGQIKISGEIDPKIKKHTLLSLERIKLLAQINEWGENSEINNKMIKDLQSF